MAKNDNFIPPRKSLNLLDNLLLNSHPIFFKNFPVFFSDLEVLNCLKRSRKTRNEPSLRVLSLLNERSKPGGGDTISFEQDSLDLDFHLIELRPRLFGEVAPGSSKRLDDGSGGAILRPIVMRSLAIR
ncbi:hypothetical protein O181_073390 [Austropuccinia psidii MF-1]|uniref:Uncharacterized protein n=1 Tax=Austropuccinia psidii MF-1 TaxID=1389203 RepID=A0A9Q3FAF7_9BASI|nr:hypothetical protein [Austropuccinia psidii MF-1]